MYHSRSILEGSLTLRQTPENAIKAEAQIKCRKVHVVQADISFPDVYSVNPLSFIRSVQCCPESPLNLNSNKIWSARAGYEAL